MTESHGLVATRFARIARQRDECGALRVEKTTIRAMRPWRSWAPRACATLCTTTVDEAMDAVARMSPPSASKKRGKKSAREGTQAAASSKARSPFKRALDIISPPKSKRKEEYSDDEDGRDAAAELSREA